MKKNITWTEDAWDEYVDWQTTDINVLNKINQIIRDILRNGNDGIGKPEPLKFGFSGLWSRRITKEHRLVYKLTDNGIEILSCTLHYKKLKH